MANLPPGDPKLVSLIVSHLKSQGLFDQFRKDCLADVDTKPAYQNLRQRVDNFVSNHLASHTWSPHLNKNQLRNNIRQQVLKSGMLGSGIDRIISQVVDPKINHTFRPQVEKVVQDFLATLSNKEDGNANPERTEEKSESSVSVTGSTSVVGPSTSVANDAMSILETISSLNQEATTAWAFTENASLKNADKVPRKLLPQLNVDIAMEKDRGLEEVQENEKPILEIANESIKPVVKTEDINDVSPPAEDIKNPVSEAIASTQNKDPIPTDSDEQKPKAAEKIEKKNEVSEIPERKEEKKETRAEKRNEQLKKSDDTTRQKEEKSTKEREAESEPVKHIITEKSSKQKAADSIKEESCSIDSDVDIYSDVTVSSVHTSDLSSFDEESEEEDAVSDSTEEGEITSDDEDKGDAESKAKSVEPTETKTKGTRQAYVHKPYLYSKYYSDSDDELTVEQRRQSVAKEKEERLLRRQMKRERLVEKRKQKATEKNKDLKMKTQETTSVALKFSRGQKIKSSSIKEVLKEQLFLEKKVAMSKKRNREIRSATSSLKTKSDYVDEDSRDTQKSSESQERTSSSSTRDSKSNSGRDDNKHSRKLESTEECKSDSRIDREFKKKAASFVEKTEDNETSDPRKHVERLDSTSEEQQKHRTALKPEKPSKKETNDGETKNTPRKEPKSYSNERERTYSEERSSSKYRHRTDSTHKQGSSDLASQRSKQAFKDDNLHKHSQSKSSSEERSERKNKQKSDGKSSSSSRDDRTSDHASRTDENRHRSTEKSRPEKLYKRSSSDTRQHRDSQSSSRSHSSSQKISKSSSDDKNEADSANSTSRQETNVDKSKKRAHSCSEERTPTKAKFKTASKSSKQNDQDDASQKSEKDKAVVEGSTDKYRKSKSEDRDGDERRYSISAQTSSNVAKETSQKSKHSVDKAKERSQHDNRDRSSSKLEKKYSGEKSTNSKHSHKDIRRKGDGSKSEEKSTKYPDDKRIQEQCSSSERKSSKKISTEYKNESSKGAGTKKTSKADSESDSFSMALVSGDLKDRENKKTGKLHVDITEKACVEPKVAVSNPDNESPHSVSETTTSTKTSALKSKTKHGVSDSKDTISSGAYKPISRTLPIVDTNKDVPKESDFGVPSKRTRKSNSESGLESSAREQRESCLEPHHIDHSCLSPAEIYSEITDSNDGEISTSDLAEEDANGMKEAIKKESPNILIPIDISELDNLVTGNDVDGEISAMEIEASGPEYNDRGIANQDGFTVEGEGCSVNVTCTERIGSSIIEIGHGESSSHVHVDYGVDNQSTKENECEETATSSSSVINRNDDLRIGSEDAATSSNTPMENSPDKSSSERNTINLNNSREYTSSASADGNFVEDDGYFTVLSENSFEDATTSSSSDRKPCNERTFLDPVLSSVKSADGTATCSQSTSDVTPEKVGIITLKAATSSSANSGSSESAQDNATSSSNSAEGHALTLEALNNFTHTATSSDTPAESDGSETVVTHVATSSESYGALCVSEHITTHAATSSSSTAAESDRLGISERHTATSSSNVINSSRELNFEVSLVSSEIDSENIAASSSNVMDCSLADDSSEWLKNPLERESDNAASSSSSLRTRSKHNFSNVEDSKNTRATSSTQQDGVNDNCMDIISSGTLKEYPGNSSDLAMDSSTEVSVSIGSKLYTGSCSSSGGDQSPENQYVEQRKEKDNTASSSSGESLIQSQNVGDEAASSSSSFSQSNTQHRLDAVTLSSDNTEATASSSFAMNSRAEQFDRSPGNSTDTTATSSSNSANSCANLSHSTQPMASSSVAMDSSTGEDLRFSTGMDNRTNTATSSDTLGRVCKEETVMHDGVPASSSTMAADEMKENVESIVYADKVSEQAATSSNMMDSSIEDDKTCDVILNNNAYATTSTTINIESGEVKCREEVNSEATAASSSNAMESLDNGEDNATSSDNMMDSSLDGMNQASIPSKNEEAASSSSFGDGGTQEIRPEASVDRPTIDDATTSSSTERESDLVVSDVDDTLNNETSCRSIEMAAESSFVGNNSNSAITGTSEEVAVLLSSADANDDPECVERNSEDGVDEIGHEKTDEKEDAVSSASSEEQKHVNISRQETRQLGDGETDGIVTSAGTEARASPGTREVSEAFGHGVVTDVSNIAIHFPVDEVSVSHTSGLDINEDQVSETSVDNRASEDPQRNASVENALYEIMADVGSDHEAVRPTNQPVLEEGEGAVTSTGITEENYGEKVLRVVRRQEDHACSATESNESGTIMSSIETSDSRAVTEDDESAITSTGAKEEEDEGEGFVTSSGTAGEDSSFSISVEHNSASVIHAVESHSNNLNLNPEEETNDQEVDETLNRQILESDAVYTITSEITENECTTRASAESITLCDATASGPWVEISKNKLYGSEQGQNHDHITEPDNVSEEPQASEKSNDLINTSLDEGMENFVEAQPMTDVESTDLSVGGEFSNENNGVSLEQNLEDDDKAKTVSTNNQEVVPAALVEKPIVIETSDVYEETTSVLELGNISDSTFIASDKSSNELEDTHGASGTNQDDLTVTQAEETLNTANVDVPEDIRPIPHSDEEPSKKNQEDKVVNKEKVEENQPSTKTEKEPEPKVDTEKRKRGRPPKRRHSDAESSAKKRSSEAECRQDVLRPTDDNGNRNKDEEPTNKKAKVVKKEKVEGNQSNTKTEAEPEPKVETEKRKRGRPPKKRPLDAESSASKGNTEAECHQDEPRQADNNGSTNKVIPNLEKDDAETKKSEASSSEKNPDTVRRRGRKSRHSQSSSETDNSESERRRKKSECNEEDQGEDGEEEEEDSENDEEEDLHRGATTRAASRLEAQRKLPHKPTTRAAAKLGSPEKSSSSKERRSKVVSGKSPKNLPATLQASGTKRRRDPSPPGARTRGQSTSEEVPAKKLKRQ